MHNASKAIIITLIVVLLGIIFYETAKLMKGLTNFSKYHNEQLINLNEVETLKLDIEYGKYIVSYNEIFKDKDEYTFLEILENGTYKFNVNLCEGVYEYKGLYNINDKVLTLKNVYNTCSGFTNCEAKEFKFKIIDNKNLSFIDEVACLGKNFKFVLE